MKIVIFRALVFGVAVVLIGLSFALFDDPEEFGMAAALVGFIALVLIFFTKHFIEEGFSSEDYVRAIQRQREIDEGISEKQRYKNLVFNLPWQTVRTQF